MLRSRSLSYPIARFLGTTIVVHQFPRLVQQRWYSSATKLAHNARESSPIQSTPRNSRRNGSSSSVSSSPLQPGEYGPSNPFPQSFPKLSLPQDINDVIARMPAAQSRDERARVELLKIYQLNSDNITRGFERAAATLTTSIRNVGNKFGADTLFWFFHEFRRYVNTAHWTTAISLLYRIPPPRKATDTFTPLDFALYLSRCAVEEAELDAKLCNTLIRVFVRADDLSNAKNIVFFALRKGLALDPLAVSEMIRKLTWGSLPEERHQALILYNMFLATPALLRNLDHSVVEAANVLSNAGAVAPLQQMLGVSVAMPSFEQMKVASFAAAAAVQLKDITSLTATMDTMAVFFRRSLPSNMYGRVAAFLRSIGMTHAALLWLRMARVEVLITVPQSTEHRWRDALARANGSATPVDAGPITSECQEIGSVIDTEEQSSLATQLQRSSFPRFRQVGVLQAEDGPHLAFPGTAAPPEDAHVRASELPEELQALFPSPEHVRSVLSRASSAQERLELSRELLQPLVNVLAHPILHPYRGSDAEFRAYHARGGRDTSSLAGLFPIRDPVTEGSFMPSIYAQILASSGNWSALQEFLAERPYVLADGIPKLMFVQLLREAVAASRPSSIKRKLLSTLQQPQRFEEYYNTLLGPSYTATHVPLDFPVKQPTGDWASRPPTLAEREEAQLPLLLRAITPPNGTRTPVSSPVDPTLAYLALLREPLANLGRVTMETDVFLSLANQVTVEWVPPRELTLILSRISTVTKEEVKFLTQSMTLPAGEALVRAQALHIIYASLTAINPSITTYSQSAEPVALKPSSSFKDPRHNMTLALGRISTLLASEGSVESVEWVLRLAKATTHDGHGLHMDLLRACVTRYFLDQAALKAKAAGATQTTRVPAAVPAAAETDSRRGVTPSPTTRGSVFPTRRPAPTPRDAVHRARESVHDPALVSNFHQAHWDWWHTPPPAPILAEVSRPVLFESPAALHNTLLQHYTTFTKSAVYQPMHEAVVSRLLCSAFATNGDVNSSIFWLALTGATQKSIVDQFNSVVAQETVQEAHVNAHDAAEAIDAHSPEVDAGSVAVAAEQGVNLIPSSVLTPFDYLRSQLADADPWFRVRSLQAEQSEAVTCAPTYPAPATLAEIFQHSALPLAASLSTLPFFTTPLSATPSPTVLYHHAMLVEACLRRGDMPREALLVFIRLVTLSEMHLRVEMFGTTDISATKGSGGSNNAQPTAAERARASLAFSNSEFLSVCSLDARAPRIALDLVYAQIIRAAAEWERDPVTSASCALELQWLRRQATALVDMWSVAGMPKDAARAYLREHGVAEGLLSQQTSTTTTTTAATTTADSNPSQGSATGSIERPICSSAPLPLPTAQRTTFSPLFWMNVPSSALPSNADASLRTLLDADNDWDSGNAYEQRTSASAGESAAEVTPNQSLMLYASAPQFVTPSKELVIALASYFTATAQPEALVALANGKQRFSAAAAPSFLALTHAFSNLRGEELVYRKQHSRLAQGEYEGILPVLTTMFNQFADIADLCVDMVVEAHEVEAHAASASGIPPSTPQLSRTKALQALESSLRVEELTDSVAAPGTSAAAHDFFRLPRSSSFGEHHEVKGAPKRLLSVFTAAETLELTLAARQLLRSGHAGPSGASSTRLLKDLEATVTRLSASNSADEIPSVFHPLLVPLDSDSPRGNHASQLSFCSPASARKHKRERDVSVSVVDLEKKNRFTPFAVVREAIFMRAYSAHLSRKSAHKFKGRSTATFLKAKPTPKPLSLPTRTTYTVPVGPALCHGLRNALLGGSSWEARFRQVLHRRAAIMNASRGTLGKALKPRSTPSAVAPVAEDVSVASPIDTPAPLASRARSPAASKRVDDDQAKSEKKPLPAGRPLRRVFN